MADNITLNSGSGGDTIGADDIGGIKYARNKLIIGADGTNDGDVSAANPLPVTASAWPLPTGAATSASQSTQTTHLATLAGAVGGSEFQVDIVTSALPSGAATAAKQPALGTAGTPSSDVITIQGAAAMTALQVADNGGSLTVDDGGGSITVDGTVAISGTVTVGSHAVTNAGTFVVQIDGTALTRLTDIETNTDSGAVVGNGAAATAQRVTLANDSTGIVALTTSTASIGKLAANSGVDIGDVDVTSQPARAATTDTITAKLATDAIQSGTTALTPKFVIIDCATSGDNTILAAVASKKIRVLSCFVVAAGAVNVRFESGASGTALTGQMNLTTNSGFVLPFNPVGWFETASNTLLNLELSGATSVDGCLTYVEV